MYVIDVNHQDEQGLTALIETAASGNLETFRAILGAQGLDLAHENQ